MTKEKMIEEILKDSVYQPSSGVYQGAKKALESLSKVAVGQIWVVAITKLEVCEKSK